MLVDVKVIKTKISEYIDLNYFIKFFLLLIALYYFNLFFIAITDPKGRIYIPFLDQHLNYVNWIRNSLLYTSNVIAHFLGVNAYVDLPYKLTVVKGAYVELVYACLGFGLMSFWIAYIAAHTSTLKSKIFWCMTGVLSICFINSLRIAILLIALQNRWRVNRFFDHHTMFNICAYIVILLLILIYARENKKLEATLNQ